MTQPVKQYQIEERYCQSNARRSPRLKDAIITVMKNRVLFSHLRESQNYCKDLRFTTTLQNRKNI
jgi:hypothetical protein